LVAVRLNFRVGPLQLLGHPQYPMENFRYFDGNTRPCLFKIALLVISQESGRIVRIAFWMHEPVVSAAWFSPTPLARDASVRTRLRAHLLAP
jgi:hypothetical protein